MTTEGLGELGFWLGVAIVITAYIWSEAAKQQRKHELTLKLLDKGQSVDQELLEKLFASTKPSVAQKSVADKRLDESGVGGFIFLVAGLVIAFIGIMGSSELVPSDAPGPTGVPMMVFQDTGPSWPLIGLGAFCFLFGNWIFYSAKKDYLRAKAEEQAEAPTSRD